MDTKNSNLATEINLQEQSKENLEHYLSLDKKAVLSEGNRSVAIGGNVEGSQIFTGDVVIQHQSLSGPALDVINTQIESLSSDLSKEKASKLIELREIFRSGSTKEGYEGVLKLRNSSNWTRFEASLRASILRLLASMILSIKGAKGVEESAVLANEASNIEPNQADFILQARIKIFSEGHESALKELVEITTTDALNIKLACLINTGRANEILNILYNPPKGIEFDAETHRFFALALLAKKDIEGAREEIAKALAKSPNWQYVRFNAAIIDYFSALSSLALPSHIAPFPRPIFPSMVKTDNESRQRLFNASEEFRKIAEQLKVNGSDYNEAEIWRLACLANLADKHEETIEYCKEILAKDPSNSAVLSWVLHRRFDVDLSTSLIALEQKLENKKEKTNEILLTDIITLIGIYMERGAFQDALILIETRKSAFSLASELDLWRYWRGQLLTVIGRTQDALNEAEQIEGKILQRLVKTNALCEIGNQLSDWDPLIEHLENSYKEGDLDSLIKLCEIKAQLRDWDYVADKAEDYCDAIGTATAAHFTIGVTWNAKRPNKCLNLLNKYESLFPNKQLPNHLRRLRVECLIETGDIKSAMSEASELVSNDSSSENLMLLMYAQQRKGDLTELTVTARKLLNQKDINAENLLHTAYLAQIVNPSLASKLWLRAKEMGIENNPELTAFAVNLSFKLGLENQHGSLMQRMQEYAAKGIGPMKMVDFEQMLTMMSTNRNHQQKVNQMYGAGEVPLHLIAEQKNIALAQIYLGIAKQNESSGDINNTPCLYIRHGGRTLFSDDISDSSKHWRLHCDITSLLLAHKLGVLDKIEKSFKPLYISRHTTTALTIERDKLKPHQKSQLDESYILLELSSKNKFHILGSETPEDSLSELHRLFYEDNEEKSANSVTRNVSEHVEGSSIEDAQFINIDPDKLEQQLGRNRLQMLTSAISDNGFAVFFLPVSCYGVKKNVSIYLSDTLNSYIVNCRAIADSLRGNSRISEEAYQDAIAALGVEGNSLATVTPLIGSKLFLTESVADVLIGADLFERVCDNFNVTVSITCIKDAEEKIRHYEKQAKIEEQVSELINRISDGLDDGTYTYINISDERLAQSVEREEKIDNQNFKSALDLFLFELKEHNTEPRAWDVICIDDRSLNKYPFRQEGQIIAPLIGINEILLALWQRGEFTEEKYYDLILQLRESNFRYIPLSADEIIYRLKQARVENGRVIETHALATIRKYCASCLLDKDTLQITPININAPNPQSELPFITNTLEAVSNAIAKLWGDDKVSVTITRARADWILNSLYTGTQGCSHLQKNDVVRSDAFSSVNVVAVDLCNLFMRGVGMHGDPLVSAEIIQQRNLYFNWLTDRFIACRYGSDSNVIKALAKETQERFSSIKGWQFKSNIDELYTRAFMGKFFMDLPDLISQEMNFEPEMIEWLRLRLGSLITTARVSFHAHDYWEAMALALAGGHSTINSLDLENEYRFIDQSRENTTTDKNENFPTVAVVDSERKQIGLMSDPAFGLLLPDVQSRLVVLKHLRKWFDCNKDEFEKEVKEIAESESPVSRMTRLYEWRESSTELYYWHLEQSFLANETLTWRELIPPSFERLVKRFRLLSTLEGDFKEKWNNAARILLDEDDLLTVLARFSSLPIAMPECVINAVAILSDEERKNLFEQIETSWISPLRLLHFINLVLRSSPDKEFAIETARRILAGLYSEDGAKDFAAFHTILKFVNEEFGAWEESNEYSSEIRLAMIWAHACRLHQVFNSVGINFKDIISMIEHRRKSFSHEALVGDSKLWNDCAHPRRLDRIRFLTHGVASLLSGLDQSVLEVTGLPDLIRKETFSILNDETLFPQITLLNDATLAYDSLQSILGGDRFTILSSVIGSEGIEILSAENLKQSVKEYLDELNKDASQILNWIYLHTIVRDLPIYSDLNDLCLAALQNFDLQAIDKDSSSTLWMSLITAAYQVAHLADENLRQRFRSYVLQILEQEIKGKDEISIYEDTQLMENVSGLIGVALILSIAPNNPQASTVEFTTLLEKMLDLLHRFDKKFIYVFSEEVWNVPPNESEGWWHLILRLRASAKAHL